MHVELLEILRPSMGERIKRVRLYRQLQQQELAAKIGCESTYLSALENDRKTPSLEMLGRISKQLDVPIDYFYFDSPHISHSYLKNEVLAEIVDQCNPDTVDKIIQSARLFLEMQQSIEKAAGADKY